MIVGLGVRVGTERGNVTQCAAAHFRFPHDLSPVTVPPAGQLQYRLYSFSQREKTHCARGHLGSQRELRKRLAMPEALLSRTDLAAPGLPRREVNA